MIGTDEIALMPLVASGNREASAMVRDGLLLAAQTVPSPLMRADAISRAEVMARLVAANGDASDKITLAAVLLLQTAIFREAGCVERGLAYAREADVLFFQFMQAGDGAGRAMLLSVVSSRTNNTAMVAN